MTELVANQRGVSLMLLIIMITVFAAVAIGIVTLLSTRHESYSYQVQSYQAYALAHAGVEFAVRYAKDNADNFFQNPASYIPPNGKEFGFGNGKFTLRYVPGCPDTLYSTGRVGVATRQVRVTDFSSFVGGSNSLYIVPGTLTNNTPVGSPPYTYASISFGLCDASLLQGTPSKILVDSLIIAATTDGNDNQVKLWRLGLRVTHNTNYTWMWDARCFPTNVSGSSYVAKGLPPWDPVASPVPHDGIDAFQPKWNVSGSLSPLADPLELCRPQVVTNLYDSTQPNYANRPQPEVNYPNFDNNTCTAWGTPAARSHATCYHTNPMDEPWTPPLATSPHSLVLPGNATIEYGSEVPPNPSATLFIETSSDIKPPVTFYISFQHQPWDPALGGPGSWQPRAFQFTLR